MSKPQININNKYDRLIALIDMDCFYCQVEEQLNPELKGKPIAVVQYNAWRGGGIIAVNYAARAQGVTRHMRGDEAKEHCPDIELVKVPNINQKADLSKYRAAGKQVATVLQTFTPLLTKASIDEAYLDLTEQVLNRLQDMNKGKFSLQPNALKNTYVVGCSSIAEYVQDISERISKSLDDDDDELVDIPEEDRKAYKKSDVKLLIASSIVSEIRAAVKEQTGYECSAGIAHNKILAKLVCGLNKPNKQTILPLKHIPQLYSTLPIRKVQGLGGKFGEKLCEDLNIKHMGELIKFSKEELLRRYDERSGQFLYNIARGIDLENVTPRLVSKSIGCCKKFPGRNAILAITTLNHWLTELAKEISDRLEEDELENSRRPKQMVVSYIQTINNVDVSSSRTVNLTTTDVEKIVADALDVLKRNTDKFFKSSDGMVLNNAIKFLGFNVGKFESTEAKKGNTIQNMFQRCMENKKNEAKQETAVGKPETACDDTAETDTDGKSDENATTNEITTNEVAKNEADDLEKAKRDKEEELKKSFFYNYHRMRKEAEAERLRAEQEEAEQELVENDEEVIPDSDEEETFQNEMLMEELERNGSGSHVRRSNSPIASTSTSTATATKPDYLQTYAEFYKPSTVSLPKVECEQCGKQVFAHEIQIHTDEHLAFQLTQEQRDEFRNQLKRVIPATTTITPSGKKQKTTATNSKLKTPTNVPSIQKFLVKPGQDEAAVGIGVASTSTAETVETEKCCECGKNIPIIDLFEHMDYHAAKKLHDELMKSESQANRSTLDNTIINKNVTSGKSKKTKKSNATAPNGVKAVKNIASFFQ